MALLFIICFIIFADKPITKKYICSACSFYTVWHAFLAHFKITMSVPMTFKTGYTFRIFSFTRQFFQILFKSAKCTYSREWISIDQFTSYCNEFFWWFQEHRSQSKYRVLLHKPLVFKGSWKSIILLKEKIFNTFYLAGYEKELLIIYMYSIKKKEKNKKIEKKELVQKKKMYMVHFESWKSCMSYFQIIHW